MLLKALINGMVESRSACSSAHRLKGPARVVCDHEARKEDAHIDVFRYKDRWSWQAMTIVFFFSTIFTLFSTPPKP